MIHTFHIDSSNPYAKSIIEFLKTLDFVKQDLNTEDLQDFTLSPEQVKIIEKRRENRISGKSETYSWDDVKELSRTKKS